MRYKEIYKNIVKRIKIWELEHFYIVAIKQETIIGIKRIAIGNYGSISVNPYKIQSYLQTKMADGYILVHTHPRNEISHSFADVCTTNYFKQVIKFTFRGSMIITKYNYEFVPTIWEN